MRKHFKPNQQKGTSLIEVLLYLAIFSIIIFVVIDLLLTTNSLKSESESQSGLQIDAAFISSKLNYEIKNADSISAPTTLGQITSSLILISGSETHTLSLAGNNLLYQRTVGLVNTSANLNTSLTSVSGLTFQALGNAGGKLSIKVNFTLTENKTTQQGIISKTYELIDTTR